MRERSWTEAIGLNEYEFELGPFDRPLVERSEDGLSATLREVVRGELASGKPLDDLPSGLIVAAIEADAAGRATRSKAAPTPSWSDELHEAYGIEPEAVLNAIKA